MESLNPHVVVAVKLSILNPNEFDLWKTRIEQCYLMIDYSPWEVILNGDSLTPTRIVDVSAIPSVSAASSTATVSTLPNVDSLTDAVIYSFFVKLYSHVSDNSVLTSLMNDRYKTGEGYHVVPPLYTGTFMPPKVDLVFNDAPTASESVTKVFHIESSPTKPSKDMSKTYSHDAPIIEDWTSDSENETEIESQALKDKGVIDSGCSRHMTGNIYFLSGFKEIQFMGLYIVGNKMHKAFPLPKESSHWQYKFPLLVNVVPTARRLEMPLPGVCTAIEEMMKKLQEFCLITSFAFGKIPKADTFHGLQNSPFFDRVFLDKISNPLKKVRVLELLGLIKSPKKWFALSNEDSVKVCLLVVSNIVFLGREPKNYIANNLIELVDDLNAWDAYTWGEYFWRALYQRLVNVISRHEVVIYILEMYRNIKFWWKKDLLVIPRGLSWLKIGKFEKGDYGALFDEWSNPILCMAPTSTELLQRWLIHSMDYFQTLLVDRQPNDRITTSPYGNHLILYMIHSLCNNLHRLLNQFPCIQVRSLLLNKLIENVGDGYPSIVLKELAAVKQRMNAIERFIKSKSDNVIQ
nr:phospholipase-like protein [Tanacetum cinerariifolium]